MKKRYFALNREGRVILRADSLEDIVNLCGEKADNLLLGNFRVREIENYNIYECHVYKDSNRRNHIQLNKIGIHYSDSWKEIGTESGNYRFNRQVNRYIKKAICSVEENFLPILAELSWVSSSGSRKEGELLKRPTGYDLIKKIIQLRKKVNL